MGFQVDVVATPRLDLCGAAARDLQYREANGKYPMASRSQMAKEQEKLNKFLQYVNESFIIKGFAKNRAATQSTLTGFSSENTAAELWDAQEVPVGEFHISHGDGAQIVVLFSMTGDAMPTGSAPAVITIKIRENGSELAAFQQSADGIFTMSVPFLLINRSAGVTKVEVTATVAEGEVYVAKNGAFAQILKLE